MQEPSFSQEERAIRELPQQIYHQEVEEAEEYPFGYPVEAYRP